MVNWALNELTTFINTLTTVETSINETIGCLQNASSCFSNGAYDDGVENDVDNISSIVSKLDDTLSAVTTTKTEASDLHAKLSANSSQASSGQSHWDSVLAKIIADQAKWE